MVLSPLQTSHVDSSLEFIFTRYVTDSLMVLPSSFLQTRVSHARSTAHLSSPVIDSNYRSSASVASSGYDKPLLSMVHVGDIFIKAGCRALQLELVQIESPWKCGVVFDSVLLVPV